jgi:hypothetical protein
MRTKLSSVEETTCKTGCVWEDNIKIDIKEMRLEEVDWSHSHSACSPVADEMNLNVPKEEEKFLGWLRPE